MPVKTLKSRTPRKMKRPLDDAGDGTTTVALSSRETVVEAPATGFPGPVSLPEVSQDRRLIVDADEIVFRAGGATLTLRNEGEGVIEISAPEIRLRGENISLEAADKLTSQGAFVISEAAMFSDLLGKLIRINGQCVKINS